MCRSHSAVPRAWRTQTLSGLSGRAEGLEGHTVETKGRKSLVGSRKLSGQGHVLSLPWFKSAGKGGTELKEKDPRSLLPLRHQVVFWICQGISWPRTATIQPNFRPAKKQDILVCGPRKSKARIPPVSLFLISPLGCPRVCHKAADSVGSGPRLWCHQA